MNYYWRFIAAIQLSYFAGSVASDIGEQSVATTLTPGRAVLVVVSVLWLLTVGFLAGRESKTNPPTTEL